MAETLAATSHVVADRVVFEFLPDGSTLAGLITGYIDDSCRFVVERVIALKTGVLLDLLRAGMTEAKGIGCVAVVVRLPDTDRYAGALGRAAKMVGCKAYAREDGVTFYEAQL